MKNFRFVIILFLSVVILFSIYKYASDEKLIEDMSNGRYLNISTIVNNPNTTAETKITQLTALNITNLSISNVLKSTISDADKIISIQKLLNDVKVGEQ